MAEPTEEKTPVVPQAGKNRKRVLLALDVPLNHERRNGIAKYAREVGWTLDSRLGAFHAQGLEKEYFASSRIDGVLSMLGETQRWLAELVNSLNRPVVDMWYDFPEFGYPRVLLDHRAIGRSGAEHLLGCGLKNLLYYWHAVDRRAAEVRRDGFIETAEQAGVRVHLLCWDLHHAEPERTVGRVQWLAEQLKAAPKPLGVMAVNDAVASEVLEAAELAELRVPEDVAVMGVDNDVFIAELGTIPLTTVDSARERVGYEAAALLDRLMNGEPKPKSPILIPPAGVVTRRSTEILAIPEGDVADAVRFIRENFRQAITVDDVVARTFLSRRRLQDHFQAAIGHGMSEEITRQRLIHAKALLSTTTRKIDEIARMSGFGSGEHMSKVFRRELNMTPNNYRDLYSTSGRRA